MMPLPWEMTTWLPVRPWWAPPTQTTTPAAAALTVVPHLVAMSVPAWIPTVPSTGWVRRPKALVIRPFTGFDQPTEPNTPVVGVIGTAVETELEGAATAGVGITTVG